jgi:hypothetical protein
MKQPQKSEFPGQPSAALSRARAGCPGVVGVGGQDQRHDVGLAHHLGVHACREPSWPKNLVRLFSMS